MTNDALCTTGHEHTTRCWWNPDEARWVCAPATALPSPPTGPTGPTEPTDGPLVDVRDMIVVHTALRREFRLAPAAVERVGPGGTRAAAVVDRHLGFLCDMLHHHHQGEDDLLWPRLRERIPASAAKLLDEAEGQHAGIESALRAVEAARAAWLGTVGADEPTALVAALEDLYRLLTEHLDHEERVVLPLAATVLTEAEWRAVGESAAAAMGKPALVLAFGMFAYEGDPAVLRTMLAAAPAVPRRVIPLIAPQVYARRARRVHGSSRP